MPQLEKKSFMIESQRHSYHLVDPSPQTLLFFKQCGDSGDL
jgi:hypothetical protein